MRSTPGQRRLTDGLSFSSPHSRRLSLLPLYSPTGKLLKTVWTVYQQSNYPSITARVASITILLQKLLNFFVTVSARQLSPPSPSLFVSVSFACSLTPYHSFPVWWKLAVHLPATNPHSNQPAPPLLFARTLAGFLSPTSPYLRPDAPWGLEQRIKCLS